MGILLKAYPKETVRNHSLVAKARTKAQTIVANLKRLQFHAGTTQSQRSGVKLADGDTDKAAPEQAVARGALADAAKVCESVLMPPPLPTMHRGRDVIC